MKSLLVAWMVILMSCANAPYQKESSMQNKTELLVSEYFPIPAHYPFTSVELKYSK